MIKAWLRHYFGFTTKESRGFLILMSLILFIVMVPALYDWLRPSPAPLQIILKELRVDSAMQVLENTPQKDFPSRKLFAFDPNTASREELKQLGFPDYLALRLEKYRNKGGKFRTKSDLNKLYGISPKLFDQVKSYLLLPDTLPRKKFETQASRPTLERIYSTKPSSLDINSADTSEWKKIRGIGNVLASRIVKFRDKLGGFAQKEQLYEVFGLDSSVIGDNWELLTLQTPCKKIHINSATFEELAAHPYFGKKQATILIRYRNQHGPFLKLEDLSAVKTLDTQKIKRVEPYLVF